MDYSPKAMKEMLMQNEFHFKKKFGQNFIIDENIIKNIVTSAKIEKEAFIIEIGPGAGSLTNELAKASNQVLCYEIDSDLKPILEDNLKEHKNVHIIFDDFLKRDVKKDLEKYDFQKLYMVSNLPYYITTPIIVKIIEEKLDIEKIVVMVQKEVGDRFKAKPNSKDYGSLTIFLNYYFDISKIMDVSRNVFTPKPNVDSIIIEFKKKRFKSSIDNEQLFFQLIRDSFKQKRKTLKNNLKEYNLEIIDGVLKQYGFDLNVRAEQLEDTIFVHIANALSKHDNL